MNDRGPDDTPMHERRDTPRQQQEQNVIASLVELTRQRDLLSLRGRLLKVVVEVTDAPWVVLCRLIEQQGEAQVVVLDRVPCPGPAPVTELFSHDLIARTELFRECLASGRPVWVRDLAPLEAQIFAVAEQEHHDDFIVLFTREATLQGERIVAGILDLYANFMNLLVENIHDPLTRLLNRQSFDRDLGDSLGQMQRRNRRQGDSAQACYLAMLDIDHFKRVNDSFGHLYGDEVLLLFAGILRANFRDGDRIYRYGGEEFAVLLCGLTAASAAAGLERCRRAVEEYRFPQVGQVTVSIGCTELVPGIVPSAAVEQADHALYRSKEGGRNRITFFSEIAAQEPPPPAGEVELFDPP